MASIRDEVTILTAVAQTTSQTSQEFVVPMAFEKILLYMDVTAGAVLLLDMELQVYLPGPDDWAVVVTDIPSDEGITGVGRTDTVLGSANQDTALDDHRVPIGGKLRVFVRHGNATAATYKVYFKPV